MFIRHYSQKDAIHRHPQWQIYSATACGGMEGAKHNSSELLNLISRIVYRFWNWCLSLAAVPKFHLCGLQLQAGLRMEHVGL